MNHFASDDDIEFRTRFEQCRFPPAEFDHRAHVRLAYVYLVDHDTETSHRLMRDALLRFLEHHGIAVSKYHETLTRAWILAVRHFMASTQRHRSADAFIEHNPILLDSKIMLTHYSAEVLFSDAARAGFIPPDLEAIPEHNA